MTGFPSWSISFEWLSRCFLSFSWKASESSWWLYFGCSFSSRTIKSSNSEAALATSSLQIYELQNLSSSSVKSRKPLSPKNEWERTKIYSDTLVVYARFPSAVNNSILGLYSTEHIIILYLFTIKARFYLIFLEKHRLTINAKEWWKFKYVWYTFTSLFSCSWRWFNAILENWFWVLFTVKSPYKYSAQTWWAYFVLATS